MFFIFIFWKMKCKLSFHFLEIYCNENIEILLEWFFKTENKANRCEENFQCATSRVIEELKKINWFESAWTVLMSL